MSDPVDYHTFVEREAREVFEKYLAEHGREPAPSDLYHNAWRRLSSERWTHAAILADIKGGSVVDPDPLPPPVGPVPTRPQGLGVAYYTALGDTDCNLREWANRTRDVGSRHTRVWLFCPWANGAVEGAAAPGGIVGSMWAGVMPWERAAGGRYDLDRVSEAYLRRLRELLEEFHRTGQHVVLSVMERYSWDPEVQGRIWVPNQNLQPTRWNLQGEQWGVPAAKVWYEELHPSEYLRLLLASVIPVVSSVDPAHNRTSFETGNELPEKPLHYRLRDRLRELGWTGRVQVNRQNDTPSQYDNMKIGEAFDAISIHGRESIEYLDDYYPDEHKFKTFRAADESGTIDPARFILSSDGVGNNVAPPFFDEDELAEVAQYAKWRGYAFEHQAREIKNGRFLYGRLDLNDFNAELCRRLA